MTIQIDRETFKVLAQIIGLDEAREAAMEQGICLAVVQLWSI
jgi:hypothetical protein